MYSLHNVFKARYREQNSDSSVISIHRNVAMVLTAIIAKRALVQSLTFGISSFSWILSKTGLVHRQRRLLNDCVPKICERVGTTIHSWCLSEFLHDQPTERLRRRSEASERWLRSGVRGRQPWQLRTGSAANHISWECIAVLYYYFKTVPPDWWTLRVARFAYSRCPPGCRLQQLTRRGAAGERADGLITPDIFTVKSIARTF